MNLSGTPLRPLLPAVVFQIIQQAQMSLGGGMDDGQREGEAVKINGTSCSRESKREPLSPDAANSVTLHYQTWILLLFPPLFPLNGVVVRIGGSR